MSAANPLEKLAYRIATKHSMLQKFRKGAFIFLFLNFFVQFLVFEISNCLFSSVTFFTYWGLIMTTSFFYAASKMSHSDPTTKYSTLLSICLLSEFLITLIFWGFIWASQEVLSTIHYYILILYHSVPLGLLLIELALGNVIVKHKSFFPFATFYTSYLLLNFALDLCFGIVIYKVFDPKNPMTIVVAFTGLLIAYVMWKMTVQVDKVKFVAVETNPEKLSQS